MKQALLSFFLLLTVLVQGQKTPHRLFHKISHEEAFSLLQEGKKPNETFLHSPLFDRNNFNQLNNGYYLESTLDGEWQNLKLIAKTDLNISVLNNERDLIIIVSDTLGQIIKDAKVYFGKKTVKFDNKNQAYILKRSHKERMIKVIANGETIYTPVTNEINNYYNRRWQQLKGRKLVRIIAFPLTLVKRTYHYFRRIIKYKDFRLHTLYRWRNRRSNNGYIITNKPIYRPGDSIKIKVFFTKKNGRPWKKGLQLRLSSSRDKKINKKLEMINNGGGNYTVSYLLPKDTKLDIPLDLVVLYKGNTFYPLRMQVRIEDYQLAKTAYTLVSSNQNYKKGEKIILKATATDNNGNPIVDGHLKMAVTAQAIDWAEDIYIPDTIWRYDENLNTKAITQVIIPDSIIPFMDLKLKVHAWFSDSKGEIKKININFNCHKNKVPNAPKLKLDNEYLIGTGKDTMSLYKLMKIKADGSKDSSNISLPFRIKIPLDTKAFELYKKQQLVTSLILKSYNHQINVSTEIKPDSLSFRITNPRKISIYWQLLAGKRKIAEGQINTAAFLWKGKNNPNKQYTLNYQYNWISTSKNEKEQIINYKQQLIVAIEQPVQSRPGNEVPVKIKITDYKGKPASGVNLSATSINSAFSKNNYQATRINYQPAPNRFMYNKYQSQPFKKQIWSLPIISSTIKNHNLQDLLYYQIRHPKNGVFHHIDTIKNDSNYTRISQFTPFIVKDGHVQTIYMIYCNRELVYYYNTSNKVPYSFKGKVGNNRITIRTKNHEYTVEDIILKSGQKLLFSIDEDHFQYQNKYHISKKYIGDKLTNQEKEIIKNRLFIFRKSRRGTYYIWDIDSNLYEVPVSNSQIYKVGPLLSNKKINMQIQNGFHTNFQFEPGFVYEMEAHRERLYANQDLFMKNEKLPNAIPRTQMEGNILTLNDIKEKSIPNYFIPLSRPKVSCNSTGKVKIKKNINTTPLLFTALITPDSSIHFYSNISTSITKLTPGTYGLTLCNEKEEIVTKVFEVSSNGTIHLIFDWKKKKKVKASNPAWKQYLYYQKYKSSRYHQYKSIPIEEPNLGVLDASNGQLLWGRVIGENGEAIIASSVVIKNKSGTVINGLSTDFDGQFTIYVPKEDYTVEASYIGYTTVALQLQTGGFLEIKLTPAAECLEEIVVIGYSIPLMRADDTTQGKTLTSQLLGRVPGIRKKSTVYYIDGLKVSSNLGEVDISSNGGKSINLFNKNTNLNTPNYRSNFKDDAMWRPNLITDKNGETYFHYRLPDDITSWNTTVIGMDKKKRMGIGYSHIKSIHPITAELALPRFLLEGDEVNIIGKTVNYTTDSCAITTQFEQEGSVLQQNNYQLEDYVIDSISIIAPSNKDSLRVSYLMQKKNYSDGEKRQIKIHPIGINAVIGEFHILDKDTSIFISPDPNAGAVTLHLAGNQLDALIIDIEKLIVYPYGCNEQLSSKLIALLLKKQIQQLRGLPFTQSDIILKILAKLQKSQNTDGSWGWWPNGVYSNWITQHVTKALLLAKDQEYDSPSLEKALFFITSQIKPQEGKLLLGDLLTLQKAGQNFDYPSYIEKINPEPLSLYEQLQLTWLKQANNIPFSVDSLLQKGEQSLHGALHFGEKGYHFFNNDILPSLLAYEILKKAGKTAEVIQLKRYLLEQKHRFNTYTSASVLSVLLPDMMEDYGGNKKLSVQLQQGNQSITIDNFPYTTQMSASQEINIQKQGLGSMYATTHQTVFNPNPSAKEEVFTVSSYLSQGNQTVEFLKKGTNAYLIVNVEVKKDAEYVLVEIPIPAGTSYHSKPNNRRGIEAHRSYFREKVSIFCKALPVGDYLFKVDLEPRFSGKYTLNPAKVEEMYFPIFYGRNEVKKVNITN